MADFFCRKKKTKIKKQQQQFDKNKQQLLYSAYYQYYFYDNDYLNTIHIPIPFFLSYFPNSYYANQNTHTYTYKKKNHKILTLQLIYYIRLIDTPILTQPSSSLLLFFFQTQKQQQKKRKKRIKSKIINLYIIYNDYNL
eukprot:UN04431